MKQLFLDIESRIKLKVPEIAFVNLWNDQLADVEDGKIYSFPFPALFVEFVNNQMSKQLGNGTQLFDPLTVRIHLAHEFYDDQKGNFERNIAIYDIRDSVHKALQKFEPTGAVAFVRDSEVRDYRHTNIHHYIIDYLTNYIDNIMNEPVDGVVKDPPTDLQINATL